MPTLIQICRIQWWCLIFLFPTRNTLFSGKFVQTNQNCQFDLKFGTKTYLGIQNTMVAYTFVFDQKYPFWENLVPIIKIAFKVKFDA